MRIASAALVLALFTLSTVIAQTPTVTESHSGTATVTPPDTQSATDTQTITPPDTDSQTATHTQTVTPPDTPSSTRTETITPADTPSTTHTETITPPDTASSTHTATITPADTLSPTHSSSSSLTDTTTITPPETPSATPSHSDSQSPSKSGTKSGDQAYPDTISAVNPTSASKNEVVTLTFTGAAGGDLIYLVRTTSAVDNVALSCTDTATHQRYAGDFSADLTLAADGSISLDPTSLGIGDGTYHLCIIYSAPYNFRKKLVNVGEFTITGDIDSAKSTVCCDGPYGVSNTTLCYVNAVDSAGRAAGTTDDNCNMRISTLTDGAGNKIEYPDILQEPTWVSPGRFEFTFRAFKSGCKGTAGVSYKGHPFGNMVAMFTIVPDNIQYDKASSECTATGNTNPDCVVIHRDQYDNAVKKCSWDTNGDPNCIDVAYTG